MNAQAFRIFAHHDTARRGPLSRPARSSLIAMKREPAEDSANEPRAAAAALPASSPQPNGDPIAPAGAAGAIEREDALAAPAPIASHDPAPVTSSQPPPPSAAAGGFEPGETCTLPAAIERLILEVLTAAPQFGETVDAEYRRKERELTEVFVSLTRLEARSLHRRLAEPGPDDAVAVRFARLVVDRRVRLLAVLADAPRREARRKGTR